MAVETAAATPPTRVESITLSFKTAAELELYDQLVSAAADDERTVSKYTLMFLKSNVK